MKIRTFTDDENISLMLAVCIIIGIFLVGVTIRGCVVAQQKLIEQPALSELSELSEPLELPQNRLKHLQDITCGTFYDSSVYEDTKTGEIYVVYEVDVDWKKLDNGQALKEAKNKEVKIQEIEDAARVESEERKLYIELHAKYKDSN